MNEAYDYHHFPMAVAVLIASLVGTFGGARWLGLICYRLSFVQTAEPSRSRSPASSRSGCCTPTGSMRPQRGGQHAPRPRSSTRAAACSSASRSYGARDDRPLQRATVPVGHLVHRRAYRAEHGEALRAQPARRAHHGVLVVGRDRRARRRVYLALVGITDPSSFGVGSRSRSCCTPSRAGSAAS